MRAANEHFGNAGGHKTRADNEEQRVNRQGSVKNAGQYYAEDTLHGALDCEIRVPLLQLVRLHDLREQRAGSGVENPADDVAGNPQREQDDNVRVRPREKEHQHRSQNNVGALAEVADVHNLRLVEAVAQHAAHRREHQHRGAAQGQVQALQKRIVPADLQDIETDGKAVKQRADFRHQGAEKHQPVVPVAEYVLSLFHVHFQ